MACKCGHNKPFHQYVRDTQQQTGKCEFKTGITVCGCRMYQRTLGGGS